MYIFIHAQENKTPVAVEFAGSTYLKEFEDEDV